MSKPNKAMIDEITKRIADDGFLIEAGWVGLRMASIAELVQFLAVYKRKHGLP